MPELQERDFGFVLALSFSQRMHCSLEVCSGRCLQLIWLLTQLLIALLCAGKRCGHKGTYQLLGGACSIIPFPTGHSV